MSGTWFGLETARRGMKAQQSALDVTGHNLSNASTPGYSRQEAVLTPTDPYTNPSMTSAASPGQFGTGVAVSNIRRIRDEYLDNNVRQSNTDTAYWDKQVSFLQQAEASFAEPATGGVGQQLTDFFKAWQDLNNNPQDPGVKAAVSQLGDGLSTLLSYNYNQLSDIQNSIANIDATPAVTSGSLADDVTSANGLLVQIRDLTTSIMKVYGVGQQPNDLLDKRDQALEELSKYGPVGVAFETVGGKPTGDLAQLTLFGVDVKAASDNTLDLTTDGDQISLNAYGSELVNLTANCNDTSRGGSLLGLERARQDLLGYKTKLNDLATNLRDKIQATNNQPPAASYVDFFTGDLATGDFKVAPALISDPSLIDGTKASDIANLSSVNLDDSTKPYTYEEYYGMILTQAGGDAKNASDMATNRAAINKQATSLRDSVSGVSVDEELTKMLQFQYGYQASARVVNTLDGMLDVLINRMMS